MPQGSRIGLTNMLRTIGLIGGDLGSHDLGFWRDGDGWYTDGSLHARGPTPHYDVMAFGALGDGAHNDTGAIQTAFNAVSSAGGEVYFPPGTYLITAPLILPSYAVRLRGAGMLVSTIKMSPADTNKPILVDASTNQFWQGAGSLLPFTSTYHISDLGFNGNCTALNTAGTAIWLATYYALFERLFIQNTGFKSFILGDTTSGRIQTASSGGGCRWDRCWFANSYDDHLLIGANCPDNMITRCEFNTSAARGIRCQAPYTSVLSNLFDVCKAGAVYFESSGGQYGSIEDNIISDDNVSSSYIQATVSTGAGTHAVSYHTTIRGNRINVANISDNVSNGILVGNTNALGELDAMTDVMISDNIIRLGAGTNKLANGININRITRLGVKDNIIGSGVAYTNISVSNSTNGAVEDNQGWLTKNQGTAVIANGATSVVVTHGLAVTPTLANIQVTMTNNPTNDVGAWYIDTPTSTQFTIHTRADPGVSTATFVWSAEVMPGY